MNRAVFLDRDGVINRLVFNPATSQYESPHSVDDLELYPWTVQALKRLRSLGYLLFIVSNQPSYAKGKTSLKNLKDIHNVLHGLLLKNGINIEEYFYCYHHPEGIVPELSIPCRCRKPGTLFPQEAIAKYSLSPEQSWFIGDQDSDIICGQACGLRAILIREEHSSEKRGSSIPNSSCNNLEEAVTLIENAS